jgi:hypothetical protein
MVSQIAGSYKLLISTCDVWHNVHTKFYELPSSRSVAIKFAQTDITCEVIRFGSVELGFYCACAEGHCNGVIIIPPRDFEHPSRLCYRLLEVGNYDFGQLTCGITSMPNFINFRPAILWLLIMRRRI